MELRISGFSVAPNPYYRTTNHGVYKNTDQIGGAGTNVTVGIQSYLNTDNGSLNVVSRVWSATDPFGTNNGVLVSITPTTLGNNETAEFEFTVGADNNESYLLKEVVTYSDGSTSESSSYVNLYITSGGLSDSILIMQSSNVSMLDIIDNSSGVEFSGNPMPISSIFTTSDFDITQPNDFIYDVSLPYGSIYTASPIGNNFSVNVSNDVLLGLIYQTIIFNP